MSTTKRAGSTTRSVLSTMITTTASSYASWTKVLSARANSRVASTATFQTGTQSSEARQTAQRPALWSNQSINL